MYQHSSICLQKHINKFCRKNLDTFHHPYHSPNLAYLRKKFSFFIRFYYYSNSNIKVKSCEESPSPQPSPFFLQKRVNSYFGPKHCLITLTFYQRDTVWSFLHYMFNLILQSTLFFCMFSISLCLHRLA